MHILAALIAFDEWLFLIINNLFHNTLFDWIFLFFSFYPLIIWILIGIVVLAIEGRKNSLFFFQLLVSLVLAGALASVVIKPVVRRPRPDISYGAKMVFVSEKPAMVPFNNDFAFPSGHAAVAFAGAYVITQTELRDKKKKLPHRQWVFYFLACLTAFSRIYLGKHYPLDILFGGLIGVLSGMFCVELIDWIEKNRKNIIV